MNMLYFGCSDPSEGHRLRSNYGAKPLHLHIAINGLDSPDTLPSLPRDEGKCRLTYREDTNTTILAWWDTSVDHRQGSNSALLASGRLTAREVLDAALSCPIVGEWLKKRTLPDVAALESSPGASEVSSWLHGVVRR